MGVDTMVPADPEVEELSSEEKVPVVLLAALGNIAELEERLERQSEANFDEEGSQGSWMLHAMRVNIETSKSGIKRRQRCLTVLDAVEEEREEEEREQGEEAREEENPVLEQPTIATLPDR